VALAPFVGAFADRLPKGQVMLLANSIKIVGCLMMLFEVDPMLAYAVVGLGAAAYSPAKYGILTEYLPHRSWWWRTAGSRPDGGLDHPRHHARRPADPRRVSGVLLHFDMPLIETSIDTAAEAAIAVIVVVYAIAALFNLEVPQTGVPLKKLPSDPVDTLKDFRRCVGHLWRDRLGQISLAVTTLFWGAGATLQFILIEWARVALGFDLSKAAILQGVSAFGIALGAVFASMLVALDRSVRVIPLGILMGLVVLSDDLRHPDLDRDDPDGGDRRPGRLLRGADERAAPAPRPPPGRRRRSIAVQNFNENTSILVMIALYSLLLNVGYSIYT
jgi:MFS family permease